MTKYDVNLPSLQVKTIFHIHELVLKIKLKATFQEVFGNNSGSENSFDLSNICRPQIFISYRQDAPELLSFLSSCLEPGNDNLKEFLEFSKLILDGNIQRKRGYEYNIQRPGEYHHARWMSKAIYTLKVNLLLSQFPYLLPYNYKMKQMEKMTFLI